MNIRANTSVDISFTEEEKDILGKAQKFLDEAGCELWQNDNDDIADLGYLFTDTAEGIKNVLTGNY